MPATAVEPCPGCEAQLPRTSGPTHRYIGASPACWAIFAALVNGGEPPVAPAPFNALLVDAYAVQHPGTPSPQAIQSVAVHLLTLYGVLVRGARPDRAVWIRQQALRQHTSSKRGRFHWLTPPSFSGSPTVADIVQEPTPAARTAQIQQYVSSVWLRWAEAHGATIATWYDANVAGAGPESVTNRKSRT